MKSLKQIQNKIIQLSELERYVAALRSQNRKIVFTNGCFDILHKGHVEYLAQAADLGDFLIVGINSDDSVKRQEKGSERPINPIEARSLLLASLEFVEGVVVFEEDTPEELIKAILPDVLVKGADYDPKETDPESPKYIVGRNWVLDNGGEVSVIDLVPGYSTTNIVNKLQNDD